MKICILQSSYENSNAPFASLDPYCEPQFYYKNVQHNHTFETALISKAKAAQQIRDLAREGFDVFINLCDGAFDEDRAGKEVVQLLEFYNQAYTGGDINFYEPSKELMKMIAYYYGVKTPAFIFAYNENDVEEAVSNLRFPMIVKHYNGYSSVGMTRDSRCTTPEQLRTQATKMIKEYGGALIEEFVEGREFTVLVAENPDEPTNPIAFVPVECKFANGETFKHFDLKWKEYNNIKWVRCTDDALAEKMKELSKKVFVGLGGVGYGRTDIRVDANGEPYFLEINPNCGIFYPAPPDDPDALGSADFILKNDPIGHVGFIEHIMKCAIARLKKKIKNVEVRFKPSTGYALFANTDIKQGEVVIQFEEKAQNLVTKQHVEKTWKDPLMKKWFDQYAFPFTDSVFGMWSEDPTQWRQINHACDPNSWLDGLDIVARKDIPKNSQITIDYATFCATNMEEFKCSCGASKCRGTIKTTDYLLPELETMYEGHLSDFVLTKRKQLLADSKH